MISPAHILVVEDDPAVAHSLQDGLARERWRRRHLCAGKLPAPRRARRPPARRMVDNFIDNACKFTPPGGTVSIALRREHGMARLSVSDKRIGIPAEDLPQLFNRFHHGRNATLYAGSGLGLAIVKAILQP